MSTTDEQPVYFGRIDRNWSKAVKDRLWERKLFGAMYTNEGEISKSRLAESRKEQKSGNQQWYETAGYKSKTAIETLERMWDAAEAGALIFADFGKRGSGRPSVLIGRAKSRLKIEPIPIPSSDLEPATHTERFKCIELEEVKPFHIDPVLAAVRPRQMVFCRWHKGAQRVRAIYAGDEPPRRVTSLTPGQLEALCYEYLTEEFSGFRLLLPVGRTLPDIDIYGWLPSGERVAAQVTHTGATAGDVRKKIRAIRRIQADQQVLFAGGKSIAKARAKLSSINDIQCVPVEEVFDHMAKQSSSFVDAMLKPSNWPR